jgi:hypothetical protein
MCPQSSDPPGRVNLPWVSPAELEQRALDNSLWNEYLNTEVYFETSQGSVILRPLAEPVAQEPPCRSLHVISAIQPGSDPRADDGIVRLALLTEELRQRRLGSIRAVGLSMTSDYCEEGRAVFGLDDAAARALGRRFGQVAIFSWHGSQWSLLACAHDREEHRSWQLTDCERREPLERPR